MINLAIEDAFVWSENVFRISFHFFSFLIDTFLIISFRAGSQFFFMLHYAFEEFGGRRALARDELRGFVWQRCGGGLEKLFLFISIGLQL